MFLHSALWAGAVNFLDYELGAVSKVPRLASEDDFEALAEPIVRLASKVALISVAWKLRYDCKPRFLMIQWI